MTELVVVGIGVLLTAAGVVFHKVTWVPTDEVLRAEARARPPVPIDRIRVGRYVRIDGVVVGPADGTWLEAPLSRVACVAYSIVASPMLPREAGVDFVVEVTDAHARVSGRALHLEVPGTAVPRSHPVLGPILEAGGVSSTVDHAIERTLVAGSVVTIVAYAAGREPDPDRDGTDYRGFRRPTRVVLRGRGASTLVLDRSEPPASAT